MPTQGHQPTAADDPASSAAQVRKLAPSSTPAVPSTARNAQGATKRIWAACEPCRGKRARCDGSLPCSGCLLSESSKLGLTLEQYRGQTGSALGEQIFRNSAARCHFNWNRKKRGPRSKTGAVDGLGAATASVQTSDERGAAGAEGRQAEATEAQPIKKHKTKRNPSGLQIGMPRSAQSAGFAFLEAKRQAYASASSATSLPRSASLSSNGCEPSWSPVLAQMPALYHSDSSSELTPSSEHSIALITPLDHPSALSEPLLDGLEAKGPAQCEHTRLYAPPGAALLPRCATDSATAKATLLPVAEQRMPPPPPCRPMYLFAGKQGSDSPDSAQSSPGSGNISGASSAASRSRSHIQLPSLQELSLRSNPVLGLPPRSNWSQPYANGNLDGMGSGGVPTTFPPHGGAPTKRKASHSRALLAKLSRFYAEDDLPFIALSMAQFGGMDAMCKLFPSKYLFGDNKSSNPADGIASVPDHIQLALLSLLAHRSLLTPASSSSRDLDLAAATSASTLSDTSCTTSTGLPITLPLPPLIGYEGVDLVGKSRDSMLSFARRSYEHAAKLRDAELRRGVIDARILITGWALDLAMSEDGAGTATMTASKVDLVRIVLAWKLHLMDAPPDAASPLIPEALTPTKESPCALGDGRFSVNDAVEKESIRRIVHVISASFVWTSTIDCSAPAFDMCCMQVQFAADDDMIHADSAWQPERRSRGESLLRSTQYAYNLFFRVTRMLHTPLDDLVNGRGPETDIQGAVDEIEDGIAWVKRHAQELHVGNLHDTLRVTLFMHTRIVELKTYRLFSVLSSYMQMCFGCDANQDLGIGATLLQDNSDKLSSFNKLSGATHLGTLPKRRQSDSPNPTARLRFSNDPKVACCSLLWEVEEVANVIIAMLHSSVPPNAKEVGTAAGVTIDASVRAVRWPRHLRIFGQHAFAMAAEVHALGSSWSELVSSPDPLRRSPSSSADITEFNFNEFIAGFWRIGSTLITLLRALEKTGSAHAAQTADKLEEYRQERIKWMLSQGGSA
ncbi:hypothetical protein K437DRAFT_117734 [Tilletiaria anomala UBC 951]|uniref:Zn(2)-C6 fungal-type domain-containing protein n=1 Tax=Tilletiaria anomala (strain ATCC 24038 / CBS 436.72 / UBC 951) TaxID=1037660 RepID=A0A066WH53_TILAU|nr:uncharacterized protein K437DRAFT_117734 [Tilletiaria anomala UBC 951]KDN53161.1 hypothetical protein K437DRAFT_117734 [Tilletiaria anomala UBC 951]